MTWRIIIIGWLLPASDSSNGVMAVHDNIMACNGGSNILL